MLGPGEFVNLIANASYICTDSFHGTLFSLIFHKQFSCLDTKQNHHDTRKKRDCWKVLVQLPHIRISKTL
ncbi:MAG: polysaccharide pyruvyl transferase family protein [Faecalibacterium prausnitzii]